MNSLPMTTMNHAGKMKNKEMIKVQKKLNSFGRSKAVCRNVYRIVTRLYYNVLY